MTVFILRSKAALPLAWYARSELRSVTACLLHVGLVHHLASEAWVQLLLRGRILSAVGCLAIKHELDDDQASMCLWLAAD